MAESNDDDIQKSLDAAGDGLRGSPHEAGPEPAAKGPDLSFVAADLESTSRDHAVKKPEPVEDVIGHDTAFNMAFLGTGQGGGRMANSFWDLGYRRVGAFNLTANDFEGLDNEMPKFSLDVGGAGKDTEVAYRALTGRDEEVYGLLGRAWGVGKIDCALICVSLGGGTGSGTVDRLAAIARKYLEDHDNPPRVGVVASLPVTTDGYRICRNAVIGMQQLMGMQVSPVILIDNGRIQKIYNPPMAKIYAKANSTVANLLHVFNAYAAVRSEFFTFDPSELGQLLDSGLVTMAASTMGRPVSPGDVAQSINDRLSGTVLADVDLTSGNSAACLFVCDQETLDSCSVDFFDAGFTTVNRTLQGSDNTKATVVHRGLFQGSHAGIQVYTMIGGLQVPQERLRQLAEVGGLIGGNQTPGVAEFLGVS